MSRLRAFIAVEIPLEIRQNIQHATSNLRRETGSLIRWVAVENMHLTLKFLGDIPSANVEVLTQMIHARSRFLPLFRHPPDRHRLFPKPKAAARYLYRDPGPSRVGGVPASTGICNTQTRIQFGRTRLRSASDNWTGPAEHLSPDDQQKIRRALEESKIDSLGTARVNSVHLYKSDLKPTGPVYTKLFSAHLKK